MTAVAAIEIGSLIVSAIATGASVVSQQEAADAQEQQFRIRQNQLRLQHVDAARQRTEQIQRVFGRQAVNEVARGISLASPSFKAIQQQSFNAFNDDNRASALNLSFQDSALNSQIDATRNSAEVGEFGSIANFAASAFGSMNLNNPNNVNRQQVFDSSKLDPNEFRGRNALPTPFSN